MKGFKMINTEQCQLTIFTPTYNRAHVLGRTYKSLVAQTNKKFIWLIIDDGSIDETKDLVQSWIDTEREFEIRYLYKSNGGMHTAHNLAYANITTELNLCIDSDDSMPPRAVEFILDFWEQNRSKDVGGIIALDADMKGHVLGTRLPKGLKQISTTDLYGKYRAMGDKKFIYKTSVINSVPEYPEFEGERLVPLGYKYFLVAEKYEMLLLDEVVCLVDYQADGSTNTIFKQYIQSPRGFAIANAVGMCCAGTMARRLKSVIHYIAECRIAHKPCLKESPRKILTLLLYPLGCFAESYIKYVNRKGK